MPTDSAQAKTPPYTRSVYHVYTARRRTQPHLQIMFSAQLIQAKEHMAASKRSTKYCLSAIYSPATKWRGKSSHYFLSTAISISRQIAVQCLLTLNINLILQICRIPRTFKGNEENGEHSSRTKFRQRRRVALPSRPWGMRRASRKGPCMVEFSTMHLSACPFNLANPATESSKIFRGNIISRWVRLGYNQR